MFEIPRLPGGDSLLVDLFYLLILGDLLQPLQGSLVVGLGRQQFPKAGTGFGVLPCLQQSPTLRLQLFQPQPFLCLGQRRGYLVFNDAPPHHGENDDEQQDRAPNHQRAPGDSPALGFKVRRCIQSGPELCLGKRMLHRLTIWILALHLLKTGDGLLPFACLKMGQAFLIVAIHGACVLSLCCHLYTLQH